MMGAHGFSASIACRWAASSVGRASRSQRGGRGFESPAVHHSHSIRTKTLVSDIHISKALKDYSSVAFDDEDGLVVNKILIADLPEIIVSSYGIIQEGITDFLRRLAVMVPHHRFKLLALFLVAAVVDSVGVEQKDVARTHHCKLGNTRGF